MHGRLALTAYMTENYTDMNVRLEKDATYCYVLFVC